MNIQLKKAKDVKVGDTILYNCDILVAYKVTEIAIIGDDYVCITLDKFDTTLDVNDMVAVII